jgi:hypothetical protein
VSVLMPSNAANQATSSPASTGRRRRPKHQLFARAVNDDRPRYRGAMQQRQGSPRGTSVLADTVRRASMPLLRVRSHAAARN